MLSDKEQNDMLTKEELDKQEKDHQELLEEAGIKKPPDDELVDWLDGRRELGQEEGTWCHGDEETHLKVRKLLQFRQPEKLTVTREEFDGFMDQIEDKWPWIVEEKLEKWLKSKGIEVAEK